MPMPPNRVPSSISLRLGGARVVLLCYLRASGFGKDMILCLHSKRRLRRHKQASKQA